MSGIRLSRRAEADLRHIWDYIGIEKRAPLAADKQLKRIYETLSLLAGQPLLGQLREDLRPGLRIFSSGSYVILYYPLADGIEVIAVEHGARQIDDRMRRSGD